MKNSSLTQSPLKVLAGCVMFVVLGLWLVSTGVLFNQIFGGLSIAFFGLGGIAFVCRNTRFLRNFREPTIANHAEPKLHLKDDPSTVQVTRVVVDDEEVLECWKRSCSEMLPHFQSVSIVETVDSGGYRNLTVGAGEFYQAEPEAGELENAIVSGLSRLPGVTEVLREDTEVWLVVGDLPSIEVIQHAAIAVDGFHRNRLSRINSNPNHSDV